MCPSSISHLHHRQDPQHNNGSAILETIRIPQQQQQHIYDSPQLPSPPVPRSERPKASAQDVLKWITRKKAGSEEDLPGIEWLKRLDGRDQIFLIDDSESMKPHWKEVQLVWDALAYLVKPMDKDRIELRFVNSYSLDGQHRDRASLKRRLGTVEPGGQGDMALALNRILPKCFPETKTTRRRSSFRFSQPPGKMGYNIYIFTDGVWSQESNSLCEVQDQIRDLVNRLVQAGKLKHVSIQFIRFGNDPTGKKRLQELDDGMGQVDVSRDIIDTEPADGNVFKMLIGSTDSVWDDLNSDRDSMST